MIRIHSADPRIAIQLAIGASEKARTQRADAAKHRRLIADHAIMPLAIVTVIDKRKAAKEQILNANFPLKSSGSHTPNRVVRLIMSGLLKTILYKCKIIEEVKDDEVDEKLGTYA